ncbi:MAG: TrkA family potassium uptake protein [Planctomycetaceae bacterium]
MNEKKSETEYIVIAGCGRLGAYLANQLSRQGHSVVMIDVDDAKFRNLSAEFSGFRLEGDASELAMLKQAKADKADKLIAVTRDDNLNLAVAQIARVVLGVPVVVARVNDPQREAIFRELGVHTVCPLLLAHDDLMRRFAATAGLSLPAAEREMQP